MTRRDANLLAVGEIEQAVRDERERGLGLCETTRIGTLDRALWR